MPLAMITKTQTETNCLAKVVKFLDRLDIGQQGDTEGLLELIVSVDTESQESLSRITLIIPNEIKETSLKDVTDTLNDPQLHFNTSYSKPVRRVGTPENRLYEVDGVMCYAAKEGINIASPMDNYRRLCIVTIDFEPIQPGESRIFRLYYEMNSFAEIFPSIGFFAYHFNNAIYEIQHRDKLQAFVPLSLGIDRSLCEISIYIPEGYIYSDAFPAPQAVVYSPRCKILSNKCYDEMKQGVYYDLEGYVPLPGRAIGQILRPLADQEVTLYCQFRKPAVASESFEIRMAELSKEIDRSAERVTAVASEAERKIGDLSNFFDQKVRRILRQSWTVFGITLIISLIAIILGIIQIYAYSERGYPNENTKKVEAPLTEQSQK
ncbi:MAG: hypothetical protein ACOC7P_03910 [Chloroflexota bacterium]